MTDRTYDITEQFNRQYRTKMNQPTEKSQEKFANGCEAFNYLSPMPTSPINLGDGRFLHIREWKPVSDMKTCDTHLVDITVVGFISYNPKEADE